MTAAKPPRRLSWRAGAAGLALVVGLAALLAWTISVATRPEDEAWARIQARGVLVVATDASFPPFSAVDANGALFGFDIDLGDELGRRLGVRVEYENITYDALLSAVAAGRDDAVISAFVPQPERLKEVSFTRPYFVAGTLAVARQGDQPQSDDERDWQTWAAGRRLAVEFGAGGDVIARRWARQVEGLTVLAQPTALEALEALAAGQAEVALVDAVTAYEFLKTHPDLAPAGPPLDPEPYAIAVGARSRELLQAFERALEAMQQDGTLAALRVKWFGAAVESGQ